MKRYLLLFGLATGMVLCAMLFYLARPPTIDMSYKDGRAISSVRNLSVAVDLIVKEGSIQDVRNIGELISSIQRISNNGEFAEEDRLDPWGEEWSYQMTQLDDVTFVRIESARRPWYGVQLIYRNKELQHYVPSYHFLDAKSNEIINDRECERFMNSRHE